MISFATVQVHIGEHSTIDCESHTTESIARPYPVVHIGPVTIFPTEEQVRLLRDRLDQWLAQQDHEAALARANRHIVAVQTVPLPVPF